jgi:hypothetical protein
LDEEERGTGLTRPLRLIGVDSRRSPGVLSRRKKNDENDSLVNPLFLSRTKPTDERERERERETHLFPHHGTGLLTRR